MQKQKLKIDVPKGYEFDSFDQMSSEILFKEKPKEKPKELPTTIDELLEANGISSSDFDKKCADLTADEKAYVILKLLAKTLNQGWEPDWSDAEEYKYYPWFEMRGSSGFRFGGYAYWFSGSHVGSRLCFKSIELAMHAGKCFERVYEQFMVIQ